MRTKERPHQPRCVDTVAGAPDEPFRQRLATGPGVASSFNGIEHHRRVVSALRVFEASDVRGDHGIDRVRSAPVSSGPTRRKGTDALKSLGGDPREPSLVRSSRIGGPVKRDHRHRSLVRAPAERHQESSSYHPDRGDPDGRRDRKSTRLNSSHGYISYAVFCLKKKKKKKNNTNMMRSPLNATVYN